jgi:hypothetical protein
MHVETDESIPIAICFHGEETEEGHRSAVFPLKALDDCHCPPAPLLISMVGLQFGEFGLPSHLLARRIRNLSLWSYGAMELWKVFNFSRQLITDLSDCIPLHPSGKRFSSDGKYCLRSSQDLNRFLWRSIWPVRLSRTDSLSGVLGQPNYPLDAYDRPGNLLSNHLCHNLESVHDNVPFRFLHLPSPLADSVQDGQFPFSSSVSMLSPPILLLRQTHSAQQ